MTKIGKNEYRQFKYMRNVVIPKIIPRIRKKNQVAPVSNALKINIAILLIENTLYMEYLTLGMPIKILESGKETLRQYLLVFTKSILMEIHIQYTEKKILLQTRLFCKFLIHDQKIKSKLIQNISNKYLQIIINKI